MNEFFKKHTDTAVVLTSLCAGFLWMNTKFNSLEKDMSVVKTVLIMQKIMPAELAVKE